MPRLVLGSSSPRRRDLLAQIAIVPDHIVAPEINETPHRGESPRIFAARMAREKNAAICIPNSFILTADTMTTAGAGDWARKIMW